ncbi:MAG: biopolymer transporter ExbD [Emcibacter sp.]|nr:biopolymer transporter ExbD [Emcibacter sp.]
MGFFTSYKPRRVHISLTPLIDVVFILLVFFMLTSTFAKDWVLPFKIPELVLTDELPSAAQSGETVNILVVLPQEVKWRGEIMPLDQVIDQLERGRDLGVILMADPETDIARFVNIVDALRPIATLKIQMVAQHEKTEDRLP